MYRISDAQIDFILNDIRARGVELEDLQLNLLDHVCCVIESELEDQGDFEAFYEKTIRRFYKDALWEIEEETISLLTFKHYYTMKKLMIWSGAISILALSIGICFKYLHWPGASFLVVMGILTGTFVFVPLLFTLKAKEQQQRKDKIAMALGALGVILVSLSFLFKVMHLPYAIALMYASAAVMLCLFLPVFVLSGIRRPETRLNTLTTSMLVVFVYGLLFMMLRTPKADNLSNIKATQQLGMSLAILNNERRLVGKHDTLPQGAINVIAKQIRELCSNCRSYIVWRDYDVDTSAGIKPLLFDISKNPVNDQQFKLDEKVATDLQNLETLVADYNRNITGLQRHELSPIPTNATLLDKSLEGTYLLSTADVIQELTHIEMFVLQNSRALVALHEKPRPTQE